MDASLRWHDGREWNDPQLHLVIPDLIRDPASSVRQQRADRQVRARKQGSGTPDQVRGDEYLVSSRNRTCPPEALAALTLSFLR